MEQSKSTKIQSKSVNNINEKKYILENAILKLQIEKLEKELKELKIFIGGSNNG